MEAEKRRAAAALLAVEPLVRIENKRVDSKCQVSFAKLFAKLCGIFVAQSQNGQSVAGKISKNRSKIR
jgi:hypothetical protein